jgi:hypothetical protein
VQKSNVYPIRCSDEVLLEVQTLMPCEISTFPCRYLGLPLSLHKLSRQQFQPIVDKIANQLLNWKADLMTRAGRRVQVQHVLTSMTVYLYMAVDTPQWGLDAIDKIRRGFLCRGRKEARGGHCLVAWGKVCRLLELEGLSISSFLELCWALRIRWLWLQKTDHFRPWSGLHIQVPKKARVFLSKVVTTEVGDGTNTKFWKDKWLHGKRIAELFPRLFGAILKRFVNCRTLQEAIVSTKWISDIKGALSVGVLTDYFQLWDLISGFELQPEVEDKHIFSIAPNSAYSAKSAYEGLFLGSVTLGHYKRIWRSWALPKCCFFIWLVAQKRCWAADRLAKRGLNHPEKCLLCDQEEETLDHLLVKCSFSREF